MSFTEDAVQRLASDDDSYKSGHNLIRKKSFLNPGISADKTWLLGECKGSGKNPYVVSVDVANAAQPTFRCNCPSRKFPCKHSLGLLLLYVQSADQFKAREPSEELQAKREKKTAREQKKTEEGGTTAKPKKVNVAALQKKIAAQRDGLDLLEKLVVDLVAGGQWYESNRLARLDRQAKQLGDAFLNAAMFNVNRLVVLGREDGISDDERNARASDLIGQLWATVQKGRNYLEEKLSSDENQAEADAVIEEVLGKTWQLTELKEKGYFKADLHLFELAYECFFDAAQVQQIEHSHLVNLTDGAIYQATALRPLKALKHTAEQPSYMQPLLLAEAAVYPGFLNRRVRWAKSAEKFDEMKLAHLEKAYTAAKAEFKGAIDAFKQQLKHPLAPRDAIMLLRCQRLGKVGERVVLEDSAGLRLEAIDRRRNGYSNVANLVRAGGMLNADRPAVLVRLYVQPLPNTIVAEPLAILTPKHHLRLGL